MVTVLPRLNDRGCVVLGGRDPMGFRRILMRLALPVTGQHCGLLVGGRGAPVCRAGAEVSFRSSPMRLHGPLP
ncbi:hypothetical protein [Mycobacterium sp. MFM001]|uniref:hypothetical protein n=1 Tax=Mycobacterium sp. MFM001 TaxID=2049453 RepID=UPI00135A5C19|nr:hypothetical protein [Mycobacterium sp. MFM001]